MNRTDVSSSNIKSIGYDPVSCVLEVEFGKSTHQDALNRIYTYWDVPLEVYQALMDDVSHGGYLNRHIAQTYAYKMIGLRGDLEPED